MKKLLFGILAMLMLAGCGGSADKGFYKGKNTGKPVPAESPSPSPGK